MTTSKFLIIVGGPTASGKTKLAIELAQHFDTAILSCDSRQFYKEMNIGTAKPNQEELAAAKHYFIGNLSIEEDYSVGDYERDALAILEEIYKEKEIAILAGGSGLYQKAVCEGLDVFPAIPDEIRKAVEKLYAVEGIAALKARLQEVDPAYAKEVDLNNPHRLIRAIAVSEASGQPFSSFRSHQKKKRNFTPIYIETHWERPALYDRINLRVDLMIKAGLLEEARQLFPKKHLKALQTVGYQELFDHFEGKSTLEEAIELIKRNTRRYAKRQLTWTRRDGFWKHFPPAESSKAIKYIENVMSDQVHFNKARLEEDQYFLEFYSNQKMMASFAVYEKKYKIIRNVTIKEGSLDSPLLYWFFHELYYHLQNNDIVELPSELQPYLAQYGLIAIDRLRLKKG